MDIGVDSDIGAIRIPHQRGKPDAETLPGAFGTGDAESGVDAARSIPTRRLCALVYIEDDLRTEIDRRFPVGRRRAWAPCYAIDLVAVLRHTQRASRLALRRDLLLCVLLLAMMAVLSYAAFGLRLVGPAVVIVTAVAVGVLRMALMYGSVSVRSVVRRIWRFARLNRQRFLRRLAAAAVLIGAAVAATVTHHTGRLSLLVLAAGLVVGWAVVVGAWITAYMLAGRVLAATGDLADLVPPQPEAAEERARAASTANVLVYARDRAMTRDPLGPFVGAGHRLSRFTTPPVDVTIPRESGTTPNRVDVGSLHSELAAVASALAIPALSIEHRLYVDGLALPPGLRTTRSPLSRLDTEAILDRVRRPLRFERGYLCLMATHADGNVVVTMFVRAMVQKDLLQLEISVHGLPGVRWPMVEPGADGEPGRKSHRKVRPLPPVPPGKLQAVWCGMRAGTRCYWPTLLGAFRRVSAAAASPAVRAHAVMGDRRAVARRLFDFGADLSLRERLALDQKMHYNEFVDMMSEAARLQQRLVAAVADYLKRLGIDPGDFARESATIINYIQQIAVGSLNAGGVSFGNNSPATGTAPAPQAPPPPPQPSAG